MKVKEVIKGYVPVVVKAESAMKEVEHDEALAKANKVKRLKRLASEGAAVAFLVSTPSSATSKVQAVFMRDFEVKETLDGNFIVNGRDLEEELKADIARGMNPASLSIMRERKKEDMVFRSYRIDRIIRGSINWC